jgi:hypothetical protein
MTYIVIGVCSLALIATIVFMPKQFKNIGKLKDLKLNQHHKHVA